MAGRQCSKKLWQTVYDPEPVEEPLPGTVKGTGIEVGINTRLLWPHGVLVETNRYDDYTEAINRTKALIADPTVPAIFEAALVRDGVLVRVDALERLPDGRWRLNEVKSSIRIKDEHLEDVALQTYVIVGSGLELVDAYLVYINNEYIRDEEIDWNALFCRECQRRPNLLLTHDVGGMTAFLAASCVHQFLILLCKQLRLTHP
jgi:hypothetical protein